MILHPSFCQEHIDGAIENYFIQGSRVLLDENLTKNSIELKQIRFPFFSAGIGNRLNSISSPILSKLVSKKVSHSQNVRSCNFAVWKSDLISVNGFNESFIGWGREDSELVVRLLNAGIKRKNLKFAAVAYHLYHQENNKRETSHLLKENNARLAAAISNKVSWCEKGIQQHL